MSRLRIAALFAVWFLATFSNAGFVFGFQQARVTSPEQAIEQRFAKNEYRIPMRDGTLLHTTVYSPRDQSQTWPILMTRTPYSVQPYGPDRYPLSIAPSKHVQNDTYIFVHQDVRGRWMSEGKYDNLRPNIPGNDPSDANAIDESSDTYDTIDWLLKNVPNHNGKVGMWGISYPGFYCAAALPDHHPALVAVSPQAPISDFFFDDFHHHGAYLLSYFLATSTFGYQHDGPTTRQWYKNYQPRVADAWSFYMGLGTMQQAGRVFGPDNFFWNQIKSHPNYDSFWQDRAIAPHLKNITANVMTVGGLFDAEDLYGPLSIYRHIEDQNPNAFNMLVMGPWSHGDWSFKQRYAKVGKIAFGKNVSDFYQRKIEAPFFRHFLKGQGTSPKYEALIYDTGKQQWFGFKSWPPERVEQQRLYLSAGGRLDPNDSNVRQNKNGAKFDEFLSDPDDPVPYRQRQDIQLQFTPRGYMSDDQRYASQRADVLTFQTQPLSEDMTISGKLLAHLNVSTTGSSADWIVKLIDVFPDDAVATEGSDPSVKFGGMQMMIRSEILRGRFRNSYETPEPFVPNEIAEINLPLQDVLHTFKKGHRVMVQIHSTWFPLIDRNPQKYVDNIFEAQPDDFIKATHRVYHSAEHPSWIQFGVKPK
jgi:putative CocE/NonD family hydrolase